jgi:purine-nucleoside phosphorylase
MAPSPYPSPSPVALQEPVSPASLTPRKAEPACSPQDPMLNKAAPKDRIDVISEYLHAATAIRPLIGVVCGSGLGGLSKCLTRTTTVKYEDIPEFPQSTVEGHAGELVFGFLDAYPVVCMRGRFHSYEGYEMRETALPIRVMYLLGIKYLLVTNAAGGLNPDYNVGDIMVMGDHLNMPGLSGKHPLVGPNDARFGQRFTPLSECYDRKLQELAHATAERLQLTHRVRRKGVYCFVSGPTYETPTESKLLRLVGGDAVGMSTVPEVIVATHCGLRVLGLSLITNKAIFPGEDHLPAASHEEVLEATQLAQR